MMNEIDKETSAWVDEAISKFYWDFADDLSDSNSEKLNELLNGEFRDKLLKLLKEEQDFWA